MREWLLRHYVRIAATLVSVVAAIALAAASANTVQLWSLQARVAALESQERIDRLERIERLLDKILDEVQPIIEAKNSNVSIGGSIYKAETK